MLIERSTRLEIYFYYGGRAVMIGISKRWLAMGLVLVLAICLLTACTQSEKPPAATDVTGDGNTGDTGATEETSSSEPEALTLPIVSQPITLKYFWTLDAKAAASMTSYDEVACFKKMEELTGINIEWIHPPTGQEKEQFNLMVASQELPDLIHWDWSTVPGGVSKLISDGSILKLNDLINKYAPNFTKLMEEHPDWHKEAILDDGSYYYFPFIREDESLRLSSGFQMRGDWLEKLNLEIPKNIDEWHSVLTAFKQGDPNGNGQADELPFVAIGQSRVQYFEYAYGIMHNFYRDPDTRKIKYGPMESAYKDYLTTMRQWYKEGLIDPDYAATDTKNFDAKVTGNKGGSYYGMLSGNMGRFLDLMKSKDPSFKLVGVPWPVGPAGKSYGPMAINAIQPVGTAISAQSKYQKEAVKWLDYCYSEEGKMLFNFGIENESYKMVNGEPVYTDAVLHNPDGLAVSDALIRYAMAVSNGPFVQDKRYYPQILVYPEQKQTLDTWLKSCDPSLQMPPITLTEEESQRFATIMNEINTYVQEMFDKFVMGQEPLDNFDNYINTLKGMGIEEAINIEQAALDRFNARK
jgi:putative aldouronate transport system substrate-binding protein